MFTTTKNKAVRSTTLPMIMARMVAANRASYILIDMEDWEYLKEKEESLSQTTQMDLQGMPSGLNRDIVCSKDVTVEHMRKINTALLKIYTLKK